MSETKRKVPKLRFPGFEGEWEQRKLIDYLKVSFDKNKDNKFGKADVLSVSGEYGIVNQIEFQGRSFAGVSVANYGVVEIGDVVYTKSPLKANPYGIIKTNKLSPGIVSTLYAVYKPLENIDSDFVQVYFEHDGRMNNYMKPLVNKGAKNDMKVTDENALKGDVIFPVIEEQKQIVKCFLTLDNLITLHQRKLENLKLKKKALLQKLFPKNGEQFPELRFPGFTDAWEQRKLGEIANSLIAGGDVNKNELLDKGEYPVIANGLTNGGIVGYYNDSFRIEAPAVTITGRGDIGIAVARHKNFTPVVRLLSLTTDHDVNFLENAINNMSIISESTGVPQLTVPQLAGYNIYVTSIDEETIIGDFFARFDNLITLHQRKLDHLQLQKKALLQQMFV